MSVALHSQLNSQGHSSWTSVIALPPLEPTITWGRDTLTGLSQSQPIPGVWGEVNPTQTTQIRIETEG